MQLVVLGARVVATPIILFSTGCVSLVSHGGPLARDPSRVELVMLSSCDFECNRVQ